jgi:hypothetical protein
VLNHEHLSYETGAGGFGKYLCVFATQVGWGGEVEADQAISALRQAIAEAEQPDLARVGEVGVWGKEKNT